MVTTEKTKSHGSDEVLVGYDVLVIPDGISEQDGKKFIEISLLVTPANHEDDQKGNIILKNWPSEIAELAQNIDITWEIDGAENEKRAANSSLIEYFNDDNDHKETAKKIWQHIFTHQCKVDCDENDHNEGNIDKIWSCLKTQICEGAKPAIRKGEDNLQVSGYLTDLADCFFDYLEDKANNYQSLVDAEKTEFIGVFRNIFSQLHYQLFTASRPEYKIPPFSINIADQETEFVEKTAAMRNEYYGAVHAIFNKPFAKDLVNINKVVAVLSNVIDRPQFPPDNKEPVDVPNDNKENYPLLRRLMSLKGLPSFSHKLGLAVQTKVPVEGVFDGGELKGQISVKFKNHDPIGLSATRFVLDASENKFVAQVRAEETESPISENGLMRFKPEKHHLSTKNNVANIINLCMAVSLEDDSFDDLVESFTSERRGIALIESDTELELYNEILIELDQKRTASPTIKYLEELKWGLRPDIGVVSTRENQLSRTKWLSLTDRNINICIPEIKWNSQMFFNQISTKLSERLRNRDHGLSIPVTMEKQQNQISELRRVSELFTWMGESLAVSPNMGELDDEGKASLGLQITYDIEENIEKNTKNGLPPLREEWEYIAGARIVLANGASTSLKDAKKYYNQTDKDDDGFSFTAGAIAEIAGQYKPLEFPKLQVRRPSVHLLENNWITKANKTYGDTVEQMVIRSKGGLANTNLWGMFKKDAVRAITPARISFDDAELQGQFDNVEEAVPPGVYTNENTPKYFGSELVFPEARNGELYWVSHKETETGVKAYLNPVEGGAPIEITNDTPKSKGTVIKERQSDQNGSSSDQYYLNNHAGKMIAELQVDRGAAEDETITLWDINEEDFKGMLKSSHLPVELMKWSKRTQHPIKYENEKLTCALKEGETATLSIGAFDANSEKHAKINMIHAVQFPLAEPSFKKINAVTWDASEGAWQNYVKGNNEGTTELWTGKEGGSICYFVGNVCIDSQTTGSINCTATWKEFNRNTVKDPDNSKSKKWQRAPEELTTEIFSIPVDRLRDNNALNLVRSPETEKDPKGEIRALSYAFKDGRARKLSLELEAISAFKDFFPEGADASLSSDENTELWVQSSIRPQQPIVKHCIPHFNWQSFENGSGLRRITSYRIYLDEWYSSGEGEKLAIVMLPKEKHKEFNSVCSYEELGPFNRYITRISSDPALSSDPQPLHVTPDLFGKGESDLKSGTLHLAKDFTANGQNYSVTDEPGSMMVHVLPLEVKLDEDEGLYCEIELNNEKEDEYFWPFLQLGLVRYQENSLNGLELSHPIEYQMQLLPMREAQVSSSNKPWEYELTIKGGRPHTSDARPSHELKCHLMRYDVQKKHWENKYLYEFDLVEDEDDNNSLVYSGKVSLLDGNAPADDPAALLIKEYEIYDESRRPTYSSFLRVN